MLSDKLQLPRVDFDAEGGHATPYLLYGLSYPLAYVPAAGSRLAGGSLGFADRVRNLVAHWRLAHARARVQPPLDRFRRKHRIRVPGVPGSAGQGGSASRLRTLLTISSHDWALQEPHGTAPLLKYVGPLRPGPARPLPAELEEFVSAGAGAGVVVVAFASGYQLSPSALVAMAQAFLVGGGGGGSHGAGLSGRGVGFGRGEPWRRPFW